MIKRTGIIASRFMLHVSCFLLQASRFLLPASCFLLLSCGSTTLLFDVNVPTQAPPYVHRIDPASGKAGDTVTIYGFGFSVEIGSNIVSFGSASTTAASYSILSPAVEGEIEAITAVVPEGVSAGSADIYVTVYENTSNADISFTVNP